MTSQSRCRFYISEVCRELHSKAKLEQQIENVLVQYGVLFTTKQGTLNHFEQFQLYYACSILLVKIHCSILGFGLKCNQLNQCNKRALVKSIHDFVAGA